MGGCTIRTGFTSHSGSGRHALAFADSIEGIRLAVLAIGVVGGSSARCESGLIAAADAIKAIIEGFERNPTMDAIVAAMSSLAATRNDAEIDRADVSVSAVVWAPSGAASVVTSSDQFVYFGSSSGQATPLIRPSLSEVPRSTGHWLGPRCLSNGEFLHERSEVTLPPAPTGSSLLFISYPLRSPGEVDEFAKGLLAPKSSPEQVPGAAAWSLVSLP